MITEHTIRWDGIEHLDDATKLIGALVAEFNYGPITHLYVTGKTKHIRDICDRLDQLALESDKLPKED